MNLLIASAAGERSIFACVISPIRRVSSGSTGQMLISAAPSIASSGISPIPSPLSANEMIALSSSTLRSALTEMPLEERNFAVSAS